MQVAPCSNPALRAQSTVTHSVCAQPMELQHSLCSASPGIPAPELLQAGLESTSWDWLQQ